MISMDSPARRSHQRWRTNPRLTLTFRQRGLAGSASNRRDAAFRYAGNSPALREVAFAPFRDRLELRDQSASLRGSGLSRLVRDGREMTPPVARRSESGFRRLPSAVLLQRRDPHSLERASATNLGCSVGRFEAEARASHQGLRARRCDYLRKPSVEKGFLGRLPLSSSLARRGKRLGRVRVRLPSFRGRNLPDLVVSPREKRERRTMLPPQISTLAESWLLACPSPVFYQILSRPAC